MAQEESISIRTEITHTDLNGITSEPILTSSFALLTNVDRKVKTVADTTAVTLWDPSLASESCTAFDVAIYYCTKKSELELTTDASTTIETYVVTVAANTPFIISDDASFHTAVGNDMFAGTADVIDKIRAKNIGGSGDARMVLILGQT